MKRIAVIGSRGFDYSLLKETLDKEEIVKIVSGGAKGADSLAAQYARENNIELQEFLPDYKKHGRGAPLVRNKLIVDASNMVIAFWDGKSRGTKFTMVLEHLDFL
ncbi:Uncharacterized protein CHISP_2346 [Chitinispirillum alkaliphilum]|nr:Uncharacterized protein CHISP_2346 [Chitinispirillum alkaliphilum]